MKNIERIWFRSQTESIVIDEYSIDHNLEGVAKVVLSADGKKISICFVFNSEFITDEIEGKCYNFCERVAENLSYEVSIGVNEFKFIRVDLKNGNGEFVSMNECIYLKDNWKCEIKLSTHNLSCLDNNCSDKKCYMRCIALQC